MKALKISLLQQQLYHLVAVVVSHDHVHHSLHEGLEHIVIEALDWLHERLECLAKPKS